MGRVAYGCGIVEHAEAAGRALEELADVGLRPAQTGELLVSSRMIQSVQIGTKHRCLGTRMTGMRAAGEQVETGLGGTGQHHGGNLRQFAALTI